jgi:hypothetical protein
VFVDIRAQLDSLAIPSTTITDTTKPHTIIIGISELRYHPSDGTEMGKEIQGTRGKAKK